MIIRLWYLERGTDMREIARMLSKKHHTDLAPMLQFISQLKLMAERVARGTILH